MTSTATSRRQEISDTRDRWGTSGLTVCLAEDRAACEPPLRILVASLLRHSPDVRVVLFCPNATPTFADWLARFPQCLLNPSALVGTWSKYDIKPIALLTVLDMGAADVVWIDSDILVARDVGPLFAGLSPDTLATTEEALVAGHDDPDGLRARLWGMPVGRELPFTANTGVVRVTPCHRDLLEAWHELLQSDIYRAAQARPWFERPCHLAGDQEVLTALLASERFAHFPLRLLRRGRDIVQFFGTSGYTTRERWWHLRRGMPAFVHSQGFRPWWPAPPPTQGWAARFGYLYHALSPYTTLARGYAEALEDDRWLRPPTAAARLLTTRYPPLNGLPLAMVADLVRKARAVATLARRRTDG